MNSAPASRLRVSIDGDCVLCNGLARFVSARDARRLIEFVPGNESDSVVLSSGGRTFTRSTAILHILLALGFPWSWLAAAAFLVPTPIRDAVYNLAARNRRRISCPLP